MQRTVLKSKIHNAQVTQSNLLYEGSITIDEEELRNFKPAIIILKEKNEIIDEK